MNGCAASMRCRRWRRPDERAGQFILAGQRERLHEAQIAPVVARAVRELVARPCGEAASASSTAKDSIVSPAPGRPRRDRAGLGCGRSPGNAEAKLVVRRPCQPSSGQLEPRPALAQVGVGVVGVCCDRGVEIRECGGRKSPASYEVQPLVVSSAAVGGVDPGTSSSSSPPQPASSDHASAVTTRMGRLALRR